MEKGNSNKVKHAPQLKQMHACGYVQRPPFVHGSPESFRERSSGVRKTDERRLHSQVMLSSTERLGAKNEIGIVCKLKLSNALKSTEHQPSRHTAFYFRKFAYQFVHSRRTFSSKGGGGGGKKGRATTEDTTGGLKL